MATPIIRSVTATPTTLNPGQTSSVIIDAYDPDARSVALTATVTDAGGHTATSVTTLTVGDPITYTLTSSDTNVTIVQDPANPNKFTVQV